MINPVLMELWPSPHWATCTSTFKVLPSWEPRLELIKGNLLPMWSHCSWGPAILELRSSCWPKLLEFWVLNHPGFFFSPSSSMFQFFFPKSHTDFWSWRNYHKSWKVIPCSSFSLVKSSHYPIDPKKKNILKKWMTLWLYDYHLVI